MLEESVSVDAVHLEKFRDSWYPLLSVAQSTSCLPYFMTVLFGSDAL